MASVGPLLKHWRGVRGTSQLALASEARTTPRYVSFVETGRAQPSRQMVVRLAKALDLPLRERNDLLLAAGFAPLYAAEPLASPAMASVERALESMLARHDPLPAVVLDRGWNLMRANRGAEVLFTQIFAPIDPPADANVLRLFIEDGPVRASVTNWEHVAPTLLTRARREAVGRVFDPATARLVDELGARDDVRRAATGVELEASAAPVIDVHFRVAGVELAFFSVVSTIGTPIDVTAQELRVESFFPADEETAARWMQLVSERSVEAHATT